MALPTGTRLGPYEIRALIGEGGMGQVYEARDTKLNRNVAIKILPPSLASDVDRLARFRREAQVLASLNHPNIAAIHGLEDEGDAVALVMELVPGEDLAQRIARGAMPLEDALPIARQIAAALEAAHEQGIVHRDLKPANVKVTGDGTVKVLDFGLAKALDSGPGTQDSGLRTRDSGPAAPTMTSPAMTEMGMILGTAGYMAPEQAKGKSVDRRADLWAFGVVLFEMLAGKSLYRGETVTETIAHVITQPPSWDLLPASLPTQVRRLLRRCLEKDPRNRLQSAGDARIEIDEILSGPPADMPAVTPATAASAAAPAWRRALPWALAVVAFAMLGYQMRPRPAESISPVHLEVQLTPEPFLEVSPDFDGSLAVLSPDGRSLVYPALVDGIPRLYLRPLDRMESSYLPGTDNATQPFFSPDGRSLGFFTASGMMQMPLSGGAPQAIAPSALARGGTWGPDGTIVFAPAVTTGLSRVSAGGTPEVLTTLGPNERSHRWPWFLPDGKHVLFMCQMDAGAYDDGNIEVVRIDTGERKMLIRGGTFPRYVNGYLVYSRGNTVLAARFDPETLEVLGEPRPVLNNVYSTGSTVGPGTGNGAAQFAVAGSGTAVYLSGSSSSTILLRLAVLDRQGKTTYEFPEARRFSDPRFSPDGTRIAVRVGDGSTEHLYVLDPARGTLTRVTFEGTLNGFPVWSHDGRQLAFASDRDGKGVGTYIMPSDGTGEPRMVSAGSIRAPSSFSPDDQLLVVTSLNGTQADVEVVTVADGALKPFVNSTNWEVWPQFSPDGRWVAYQVLDASGVPEVFVRAYPSGGTLRQVSAEGGAFPVWARNGRELLYVNAPQTALMAVDVTPDGDVLALGVPRKVFDIRVARLANAFIMDVTPDGNRFVVLLQSDQREAAVSKTNLKMIFNFTEELRRATETTAK